MGYFFSLWILLPIPQSSSEASKGAPCISGCLFWFLAVVGFVFTALLFSPRF